MISGCDKIDTVAQDFHFNRFRTIAPSIMTKKTKFIFISVPLAIILGLAIAFVVYLPDIVTWAAPRFIERRTGYLVNVESMDISLRQPAIVMDGITLTTKDRKELAGKVARISVLASWRNPLSGSVIDFISLEAHGADVLLQEKKTEKAGAPFDPRALIAPLFQFQTVDVDAKRLEFRGERSNMLLNDLLIRISPSRDNAGEIQRGLTAAFDTALSQSGEPPWTASAKGEARGEIDRSGDVSGVIDLTSASFDSPQAETRDLTARLPFTIKKDLVTINHAEIDAHFTPKIPALPEARPFEAVIKIGEAGFSLKQPYSSRVSANMNVADLLTLDIELHEKNRNVWEGALKVHAPEVKAILDRAETRDFLKKMPIEGIAAQGPLTARAELSADLGGNPPQITWSADTRFDDLRVSYKEQKRVVRLAMGGVLKGEGVNERFTVNGDLSFDKLFFQGPEALVESGSGKFALQGDLNRIEISRGSLKLASVKISDKAVGAIDEVSADVTGVVDIANQRVKDVSVALFLGKTGPINVQVASIDPLQLNLKADGVKLDEALRFAKPAQKQLADWSVDGFVDMSLQLAARKPLEGLFTLHLNSLSDPIGRYMAEKLEATLKLSGPLPKTSKIEAMEVTLEIPKGEMLLDKAYLDFSSTPLSVGLNLSLEAGSLSLKQGELNLHKGFSSRFHSVDKTLLPMEVSGRLPDLNEFFKTFIEPSFAILYPALNEVKINGAGSWDLLLTDKQIEGRLTLDLADLRRESGFDFKELTAEIPVVYPLGKAEPVSQKEYSGRIALTRFEAGGFPLQNQEIRFRWVDNGYHFDPIRIPLADGILTINNGSIKKPFSDSAAFSVNIGLRDIHLGALNLLPPPYELSGLVNSDGIFFQGSKNRIAGKGTVKVAIFDGTATISDIAVESPFSFLRRILCDIDFQNLDLRQLTKALSFGRITGTLDGYAHNMAIANGQPEAFDLKVWSVRKKGKEQKVSFSAVNDIQTISSGSGGGAKLPFGVQAFIDELPYEQIGIACVLRNDVFIINGTVIKGGKEHFVSRAGLIGLDVVNMNPKNQISFKDMLERVKRVAEKRDVKIE